MILTFEPVAHKYNDGKGISVSTLIGNYKQKFDEDFWLRWKAWEHMIFPGDNKEVRKEKFKALRKDLKYTFDMMQARSDRLFITLAMKYPKLVEIVEEDVKETIKQQWKDKNEKSKVDGSAYHDYQEYNSIARGTEVNPFNQEELKVIKAYHWKSGIKTQTIDMHNLEDGYYPELILKMGEVYGQADRCWIRNQSVWIRDYKTNESINKVNPFQKMKYPLAHLDDCDFNHYSLQLSLYGYILEHFGYTVAGLGIDHFNNELPVQYMKKEVEDMITDYKISQI